MGVEMAKLAKAESKLVLLESERELEQSKVPKIGGARGIESMFRNSYRAQLDMISLAATKANIMISLNGLLVSMLLVSGAYFLSSDPLLLIPVTILLVTCTTAIVFAVLAARPDIDHTARTYEDYRNDRGELLAFSQFTSLSSEQYNCAMHEMMQDRDYLYGSLTKDLYFLGLVLNRKYSLLRTTYTVFMIGIIVSVIAFAIAFYLQSGSTPVS